MSENKEIKTNKREPPEGASEGTIRGNIKGNQQREHQREPSEGVGY